VINQLFKSQFILLIVISVGFCSFHGIHAQNCGAVQITFPAPSADTLYVCQGGGTFDLMQYASTTTGDFGGLGVQPDGVTFDPSALPPGTSQISYTDAPNFCQKWVTVVDFVIPEAKTIFCKNDKDLVLNSYANPSNGTFSTDAMGGVTVDGSGVFKFSPKTAGPGTHIINYTIGNAICTQEVRVKNVHFKIANVHFVICTSQDSIPNLLISDFENDDNIDPDWGQGAYFGGLGVFDGHFFDPSLSGPGLHSIYYTDGVDTCWDQLRVYDSFQAEITPIANTKFCADSPPVTIQGNGPLGRCAYYFNVVTDAFTLDNQFDLLPDTMALGVYDIIYGCTDFDGCPSFDTLTVEISNTIADININKNVFCESESTYPIEFSPEGGSLTFSDPGIVLNGSNLDIEASEPGVYTISYALENLNSGCSGIDSIEVEILQGFDIDFEIQTTNCSNLTDKVIYTGEPLPSNAEFKWSIDNDYELTAAEDENSYEVAWDYPGSYKIVLEVDSISCTTNGDVIGVTIEDRYKEDCQTRYFIPNVFTPNGDTKNDIFKVEGDGVREMEMRIFDRWGNQVFYGTEVLDGWDGFYEGIEVNSGVFFYTAELVFEDGTSKIEKGNITLLR